MMTLQDLVNTIILFMIVIPKILLVQEKYFLQKMQSTFWIYLDLITKATKLNQSGFSIHKIRATYVSLLRDAGLTFEAIATQVGHKSTRTTENNYSFDLKAEKENQDKITFDL